MSCKHITINECCCIVEYLNLGWNLSKIAKEPGTNKGTISREIKRNNVNKIPLEVFNEEQAKGCN